MTALFALSDFVGKPPSMRNVRLDLRKGVVTVVGYEIEIGERWRRIEDLYDSVCRRGNLCVLVAVYYCSSYLLLI